MVEIALGAKNLKFKFVLDLNFVSEAIRYMQSLVRFVQHQGGKNYEKCLCNHSSYIIRLKSVEHLNDKQLKIIQKFAFSKHTSTSVVHPCVETNASSHMT